MNESENDGQTLTSVNIIYEPISGRGNTKTSNDLPSDKLIGEQEGIPSLNNLNEKSEILSLNCSPFYNNMNNNLVLKNMFLMTEDSRHFLAPPLGLTNAESEYFQRKLTQTSNTLTMNTTSINNNTNTTATNTNNADANNTLNNATAQLIQNNTSTNINPVNSKVTLSSINHTPKARPHTCEECGKAFMLKHHLLTHMRVHTGERPHICPECGKSFALKHCLSTHLLLHTADRPYKCMECSKTFTLKHHLVSHERVHTRDRPFECPECGRRFPQKRHLTTHIKFHSGERPYSCQICGENFSREEHLVMHSRFHGGQSPYVCPDCGAGFLRKFELVNHERQHGRNPESCTTCGKEFLQKRTLLMHIRTCGLRAVTKTSSSPTQQFENTTTHLNKTCRECGESFATSEGLALHYRLHVGDHSFLTDICSLAATLKQAVPVGTLNNAVSVSKKIHECSDCGRSFTQKHGLYQHRARHPNASCKLKPYACEKCGKSFSQKNHLSLHERQHMNPPPSQLRRQQMQERQQQQQQQQQEQQLQQQQQQEQQLQQQQLQNQQQASTNQTTINHIGTIEVYNVSELKTEPNTILNQQTSSQTVTNETQPELLRHLHLGNEELQPTRIMQHIQQQTQPSAQIVNNLHKIERY